MRLSQGMWGDDSFSDHVVAIVLHGRDAVDSIVADPMKILDYDDTLHVEAFGVFASLLDRSPSPAALKRRAPALHARLYPPPGQVDSSDPAIAAALRALLDEAIETSALDLAPYLTGTGSADPRRGVRIVLLRPGPAFGPDALDAAPAATALLCAAMLGLTRDGTKTRIRGVGELARRFRRAFSGYDPRTGQKRVVPAQSVYTRATAYGAGVAGTSAQCSTPVGVTGGTARHTSGWTRSTSGRCSTPVGVTGGTATASPTRGPVSPASAQRLSASQGGPRRTPV